MVQTISPSGRGLSEPNTTSSAFVRALSQLGHGVLIIDGDQISEVSEAFCRLVGRTREALLALPSVFDLVPIEDRPSLRDVLTRYAAGERVPDHFSVTIEAASGNSVPLEVAVKSIESGRQPPRLLVIAQDLRERDQNDPRRDEESDELLARAGQLLGSSLDYEATLRQICGIVVPLRADWAAIDVIDETRTFRRVAVAHIDPAGEQLLHELDRRWPLSPDASHLRGRAVLSRKPVALYRVTEEDLRKVARDDEQREMLRALGLRSAIWVPLIARDRVLGVMSVGYGDTRKRYGRQDLELMRELARRAALAVDNSLLYRAVERAEKRQAAVATLGQKALTGLAIDELLASAAEVLAEVMAVPFVEVLEMTPDEQHLRLVAGVGWQAGLIGRATVDAGDGSQGGYTVATVGPVVLDDLATEQRFRPPLLLTSHGVISGVTVVIGSTPAPWGVLGAHSDVKRTFADDDVTFLQAVANVLAAAIERLSAEDRLNDVAEAQRARAAELKAVLESMGDAVVVSDARGQVVLANPAAEAMLGRRLGQGMSGILRAFVWPDGKGAPQTLVELGSVELQLRGSRSRTHKCGHGAGGGQAQPMGDRWMEVTAYPVLAGGTILVMRDITAARDARAVRDAFIGILSHELRTPVTTIYGGSEVLARSGSTLPESVRREVYDDIRAESDRLYRLVENLLVLSRVEREGLAIEREPILLQRLLPRVVSAEAARWPAADFKLDTRPGLPPAAAEEIYVEQVVRNLLTNAAKYGGESVVIRAEATPNGMISVTVSDEGPGFREGEENRLFEIFYRSPSATRRASGVGIGLFVSQQLIRAMGGHIWAANRPEGGAEFGFELPVFGADL
jgi:PAS domain S-box-containing protein